MLKNSKSEIAGAGSLNIRTCINYWELVTTYFELNFLLNFLDIWTKITKKETSWQKNQCPGKRKSEREVCLLFWLKISSTIGAYFIPILVLKFLLKISEKKKVPKLEVS